MGELKKACCGIHWTDRPSGHCDWTCCEHEAAVPDPTVEALSEHRLTTPVQCKCGWRETDGDPTDSGDRWATHVAASLTARAAAPDALRVRIEALIERCRGNYADDAGGGEPLRNYVLIEELRALLEDGAQ